MKLSKIITVICALTIATIMGVSAFAANSTDNTQVSADTSSASTGSTAVTPTPAVTGSADDSASKTDNTGKHGRFALTDEQKAEMEARKAEMDAISEKWSALTDAQKEEIYSLKDKASDIESQIIDKYLEWGVIDENNAADMKARLAERKTEMRENGRMPMFGGKGGFGRGRHGKDKFDPAPSTGDTASDSQTNGL